jgi:hypothetical protein
MTTNGDRNIATPAHTRRLFGSKSDEYFIIASPKLEIQLKIKISSISSDFPRITAIMKKKNDKMKLATDDTKME